MTKAIHPPAAKDDARKNGQWDLVEFFGAGEREINVQDLVSTCEEASVIPPRTASRAVAARTVARVGNLMAAREMFKQDQLLAAWNETISSRLLRPYHPEALLLLAGIARAAGESGRAKALVGHARRLAPKWRAAQDAFKGPACEQVSRVELPPLADSILKREAPTLTVCLITRNEERFLGRCLASIRDVARQIVVVDTGSTDRTVEIAREHGAEVSSLEWCDDFSAARNAALERATGDWILVLDADEELPADQHANLRRLMRDASAMAFRLPMMDEGREGEGVSYVPRLFRNAPGLFFAGRVHEHAFGSVTARCQEWGLENKFGNARLLHHGYTAEMMHDRDKSRRNLRLLRKALEEMPGDPNLLMNLGLELTRCGRRHEGLEQYAAAFAALSALPGNQVAPEVRETLLTQYSSHLLSAKEHAAVVRVLHSPLAQSGGLTATMHWLAALASVKSEKLAEGAGHARQCVAKRNQPALSPINKDILKGGPNHCLAVCLAGLKEREAAEQAFRAALQEEPSARPVRFDYARSLAEWGRELEALNWLNPLVAEDPSELRGWQLGAELALKKPEFLEFACDWTGEAIRVHPNETAIIQLRAEALLLSGKPDQALPLWNQLNPTSNPAHRAAIIICEALMDQPFQPVPEAAVAGVNQGFMAWYRRLLGANASSVILALHERVELLRRIIPEAIRWLEAAMAEARPA